MENQLIHGDNLTVMEALLDDYRGVFDLVYIDPPFATNNTFHSSSEKVGNDIGDHQRRGGVLRCVRPE